MHILALISGAYLHFVGDATLLVLALALRRGRSGYVYNEYYEFSSVGSAAFQLMPVPVGMALAGLLLAQWGWAGL